MVPEEFRVAWPAWLGQRDRVRARRELIGDCVIMVYFERRAALKEGLAMPVVVLYCVSAAARPSTTDHASVLVLGGLVVDVQPSVVEWRDVPAMRVKPGLGGRAACDLGTTKC